MAKSLLTKNLVWSTLLRNSGVLACASTGLVRESVRNETHTRWQIIDI